MSRSSAQWDKPIKCASGMWRTEVARSLVERWEVGDPVDAVRAAARHLLREAEMTDLPVDLGRVGSFCGVITIETVTMQGSGRLIPIRGGYRIEVNASESRGRRRFSCAHEICHVVVAGGASPARRRQDASTGDYPRDNEEEYLCDVGASELLMPAHLFHARACQTTPGIGAIQSLAAEFDVSLEAAAVRLTQCGPKECAVIVWEEALKPKQVREIETQSVLPGMQAFPPQPRLRIRCAAVSPGLRRYYFPPNKQAEEGSPIHECLTTDSVVKGGFALPTARESVVFATESVGAPYYRGGVLRKRAITVALPLAEGASRGRT